MAAPLADKNLILHPPNEGKRLDETHPLFAAYRHPFVRQRPRGCAKGEERRGDSRLPAQTANQTSPGKSIKGVLVEYGPGGYSPGHTHPKSAFIYATVLEGAIRSQVNDGPMTTYDAGQSFFELPGDRHAVSANASKAKPAKRPCHVKQPSRELNPNRR